MHVPNRNFSQEELSSPKLQRNLQLVSYLEKELQFVDFVFGQLRIGEGSTLRLYPNFGQNVRDYCEVIRLVREYLRSGIRIRVNFQNYGGISQLISGFSIERVGTPDYAMLLNRAVEIIAERLESTRPNPEGHARILDDFFNTNDGNWHELDRRLGIVKRNEIRERLEAKLSSYLERKFKSK